jgi:multiple sugar transport system permease protein
MAATVSLIPVLLVFFVLQRYLVAGIAATGLKG